MKRVLICLALAVVLAVVAPRPGYPHGDAAWIMANPATAYCCGPHDCERLAKDAVKILANGWGVSIGGESFVVPFGKELASNDDDYWYCKPEGQPLKCFFAPPMGV